MLYIFCTPNQLSKVQNPAYRATLLSMNCWVHLDCAFEAWTIRPLSRFSIVWSTWWRTGWEIYWGTRCGYPCWIRRPYSTPETGPAADSGQRWFNYAVLLDSVVIGRVEATAHDGIVEIAYLLNPSLWGQGLGTAATELLLNELRSEGEHDFWATLVPENVASARVVEHLGFAEIDAKLAPKLLSFDEGDRVFNLRDKTSD